MWTDSDSSHYGTGGRARRSRVYAIKEAGFRRFSFCTRSADGLLGPAETAVATYWPCARGTDGFEAHHTATRWRRAGVYRNV